MPSLKKYPCESCDYIGINRRMLARHVAIIHSKKVFRCPLCPFVTRYAANWYRHKRHLHGLSKVSTCEVCGFFANSAQDLAQHKVEHHSERNIFGNGQAVEKQIIETDVDPYLFQLSPAQSTAELNESLVSQNSYRNASPFNGNGDVSTEIVPHSDSVTFSLPLDGQLLENYVTPLHSELQSQPSVQDSPPTMNSFNNSANLKPLKIRRSYCCNSCGFLTGSPREFLYHQRDIHGMRMNIFECELCIYASKHIQKLQRHYGLVHRQKKSFEDKPLPVKNSIENKPASTKKNDPPLASNNSSFVPTSQENSPVTAQKPPRVRKEKPGLFKCSACTYHTRNKVLMSHHEKTVHFKKKFFRCLQCGYVTNEKACYTKHVKYHNLSKMQCEFCHFKSAYKWNMERHMRNHMTGTNGEYNCTLCNFVTHSKQSLKFHASNHHDLESMEYDDSQDMEPENEITSDKSGQMVIDNADWMNFEDDELANADTSNIEPESIESTNTGWKAPPQDSLPTLHCTLCNFATTWPFELKKHEEMHRCDKKHACPLCGMRFEHIAWLTKHLHRVHSENSEAQSLAAAYELMKPPTRRRPISSTPRRPLGSRTSTPKPILPKIKTPASPKQSLLSSYLKSSAVPKFSYSPPKEEMLKKALKQPESQFNFSVPSATTSIPPRKRSARHVNSCTKCSYKTKWGSELQRHMRVHTDEKPFHCPRCSYHSKWKGDLTRHIAKYHGCKLPISNKAIPLPKLRLKKAIPNPTMSQNNWENVSEETLVKEQSKDPNAKDQDSPLDLTISKTSIFQPSFSRINGFRADVVMKGRRESDKGQSSSNPTPNSSYLNMLLTSDKFGAKSNIYPQLADEGPKPPVIKKKYFCPFCSFSTSTPSRFHIHIVQHYNRRPFMCSVCGHNSNWEWDITKHIRLKGGKDKEHRNACVLLTDESGRRNYEKYEKYLRVVKSKTLSKSKAPSRTTTTSMKTQEEWQDNSDIPNYSNPPNTTVVSEMPPENIIVTPDLPFSQDVTEKMDTPDATLNPSEPNWGENNVDHQNGNFKFFLCKHCNYKHSQKKVVISHLTVHAGVRPFRCRVCGLTSCWRNVIVQHVKTLHNGYMNDVEDRITYIQEGFVIRITSVKSNNKFSTLSSGNRKAMFNCKFCPYKCDKEVYIKFHMKQHKPKEGAIYQCSYCPYYVKFKRTLVRHLKLHEAPETPASVATFPNLDEVPEISASIESNDISFPVPDYSYQQNQVQQDYAEEDSIRIAYDQLRSADHTPERSVDYIPESSHLDSQTSKRKRNKTKKHACENCPYRTDNRTQYLYHKQFHRPNASARFKCTICTYWATMQHLLTQHMKVHSFSQEDSFQEEEEMTYSSLPEHNQLYSGFGDIMPMRVERDGFVTEMFKCRHCPMMSKKKANVKIHERSHGRNESDGQFACNFCSYKSTGQGGLTNHMKMYHSGEQEGNEENSFASNLMPVMRKKVFSYFCMRCPAVFKSSSDLFIHKTFHGSSLPFPCPHCDYRAKHKIHLQKHLQVHTDAYVSKRDASFGPPLNSEDNSESQVLHNGAKSVNQPQSTKKIDQMLLLELAEVKTFLRNSKIKGRQQKCTFCPAAFAKATILAYHLSLHGSSGEFGCSQCNYATTRSANLAAHVQVHGKITSPAKRLSRTFSCPNCPAVFEKNDRFERHLNLHGQNYRFACEHCDYSVNCAANLVKHKLVHEKAEPTIASGSDIEPDDTIPLVAAPNDSAATLEPLEESDAANKDKLKSPETGEDKKAYLCDRCPYFQMRKDAVINHQNRHCQKEGLLCPYCDYRVIGLTFLQNHVKSHILPTNVFAAEIYAKFNKFDISFKDEDDNKIVLFEDKGTEIPIHQRFFPALEDDNFLNPPSASLEETPAVEENVADDGSVDATTDNSLVVKESGMDIEGNNNDDNNENTLDAEGNNENDSNIGDNDEDVSATEETNENLSDTEDNNIDVSETENSNDDASDTEDDNENVSYIEDDNEVVLNVDDDNEDATETEDNESVTDTENNIENILDIEDNKSTNDVACNSQEDVIILANEVIPQKYLPKVVLKDIFLEKKSTESQMTNLHIKKSSKTSNRNHQSKPVNKSSEKKNKSKSKSYSTSSCSQSEGSAPGTTSGNKSGIKIKIKVANVNKDNSEKSLYSIFNKKTDEVDATNDDSCNGTSVIPDAQKLPKTPDASSNSNGIKKVSEENTMDVQTGNSSLIADCNDANCINGKNNITEKESEMLNNSDDCSSFQTFHEPLGMQGISVSGDEKHPQDILKQLNSMVNGVCTSLPQI